MQRLNAKILSKVKEYVDINHKSISILDTDCGDGFISNLIDINIKHVDIVELEYTGEALEIARKLNGSVTYA